MSFKKKMVIANLIATLFLTAGAAKGCEKQNQPKPGTTMCKVNDTRLKECP